MAKFNLDILTK